MAVRARISGLGSSNLSKDGSWVPSIHFACWYPTVADCLPRPRLWLAMTSGRLARCLDKWSRMPPPFGNAVPFEGGKPIGQGGGAPSAPFCPQSLYLFCVHRPTGGGPPPICDAPMLIYLSTKCTIQRNRSTDRRRWPISSDDKLLETYWRLIPRAAPTALGRKRQQKPSSSEAAPSRLRVGSEGSRRAAYGKSMRACLCFPKVVAAPCPPQEISSLFSITLCRRATQSACPASREAQRVSKHPTIHPFFHLGRPPRFCFNFHFSAQAAAGNYSSEFRNSKNFQKVRSWAVSVSPFISHPPSPLTLLPVFWSFRYRRRLSEAPPFQSRHVNTTAPRLQQRGRQRPAAAQYEARACRDEQRAARRADATDSPPSLEPTARSQSGRLKPNAASRRAARGRGCAPSHDLHFRRESEERRY